MDWKLFATTLVAIFLAELGDKTQLATLGAAAVPGRARLTVFLASACALVLSSAVAVTAAAWIGRAVLVAWPEWGSALLFIVLGVWFMWRSFHAAVPSWPSLSSPRFVPRPRSKSSPETRRARRAAIWTAVREARPTPPRVKRSSDVGTLDRSWRGRRGVTANFGHGTLDARLRVGRV